MVYMEVCFSAVALWMYGDSRRPSGVVHQRTVEEGVAGWWYHLASIGIFGGLDLLRYNNCLDLIGSLPPGICGVVVEMHRVGAERRLGRALRQALSSFLMLIS